ncbi:MAG: lipopolysaccharide heptosyltransferase II [Candidatus Omnitrophica bacterium]|nr:lipopolysaccharide heptosyltransferase II [Candidatus Omnitrophota bacterium]
MKILQILPELNHGGVERGTVDLAIALKAMGHVPYVISNGGVLVSELEKAHVRHVTMAVHRKSLSSFFLIGKLADFFKREGIDVVHARSRIPAWIAYFAAKKAGVDFVTTCHGYYSTHFFSRVMGWGKKVIVISRAIEEHVRKNFGVSLDRLELIYRGVNLADFPYDASKYARPKEKFIVANIGRITSLKGHEDFIRAFHLVSRKYSDAEAWIAGGASGAKGRKLLGELEDLVRELGLEESVKFLGPRNDISALLHQADVLALSTVTPEGFGRVLVEAGAAGVAVVATRVGGIREIIDHEVNGLLVPPRNAVRLAEAIVRLKEKPADCIAFTKALRKKVETQFTLDQMVSKTIAVYEGLKKKKKILFFKLGSLGDLVLAIPSFRMVRRHFPDAHISLLVDERWMKIVQHCPYLNEVIAFRRDKLWSLGLRFPAIVRLLREKEFDISIDLQNTSKTHWLALLAGIPERFGYRRGLAGRLLNQGIDGFQRTLPPLEHQFQILRALGVGKLDDRLELWTDPAEAERVGRILAQSWAGEKSFLAGFVLGASPKWPTKRWPVESFVSLAQMLKHKFQARIVLLGTDADRFMAREFLKHQKDGVIDLVGKTSLGELVSVIRQLRILITPDSAPLHVATAVGTPVIALFGPTHPARHLPPGARVEMHWKVLDCVPCYSQTCRNAEAFLCMKQISAREVAMSVERLVSTAGDFPKQASYEEAGSPS